MNTLPSVMGSQTLSNDAQSYKRARLSHEHAFQSSTRPDLSLTLPQISPESVKRGKLLGEGGFAKVYEVSGLEVCQHDFNSSVSTIDPTCCSASITESQSSSFSPKSVISFVDKEKRYALKTLDPDSDTPNISQALSDLVTEARILAEVKHPNIIKLRGIAGGERFHKDFFIVVERLHDTLDQRIEKWRQEDKRLKGLKGRMRDWSGKKGANLFLDRLVAGYQLGSALEYLHRCRIVHRDLKTENAAFDLHGELKLFDFGLAKELPEKCQSCQEGLYNLTGHTGTLRYQATEVALGLPYNESCDVYSFAIVLWEILSMKRAFREYTSEDLRKFVFKQPYKRPPRSNKWSDPLRENMHKAWSPLIRQRPSMCALVNMLEDECCKLGYEEKIGPCSGSRRSSNSASRKHHSLQRSNTESSSFFSE